MASYTPNPQPLPTYDQSTVNSAQPNHQTQQLHDHQHDQHSQQLHYSQQQQQFPPQSAPAQPMSATFPPHQQPLHDKPNMGTVPAGQPQFYYQAQPGYAIPGQPMPVVMTTQPMVSGQPIMTTNPVVLVQPQMTVFFGKVPQDIVCPNCGQPGNSDVTFESGNLTYISAGVLFCVGCWLCCCIPFCMNDMKDAIHRCPNCKTVVGMSKRL
ncbi:LITAF-like zinc ribbon domain-containing protein [Zopfochytrium polystomum]|nr:LITAF-like zinc ribbon domain-containing protein [Zopfochytrium polystomum]